MTATLPFDAAMWAQVSPFLFAFVTRSLRWPRNILTALEWSFSAARWSGVWPSCVSDASRCTKRRQPQGSGPQARGKNAALNNSCMLNCKGINSSHVAMRRNGSRKIARSGFQARTEPLKVQGLFFLTVNVKTADSAARAIHKRTQLHQGTLQILFKTSALHCSQQYDGRCLQWRCSLRFYVKQLLHT